jgi:hypothetical protein
MNKHRVLVMLMALALSACGQEETQQAATDTASPPVKQEPAAKAPAKPSARADKVTFHGYVMDVPSTWEIEETTNPMRVAQIKWPTMPPDTESPSMVVFFFGEGGGGPIEANLHRWREQFDEQGEPSDGTTESFETPHAKITVLDKSGVYKFQPRMMASDFEPKPGWRMLAAVIEAEGGPFFIKTAGPEASMAAQRDAFLAVLKNFRRDQGT